MTLPNFLIIGVAKAGTTSLYRYLQEHPQVFMSPVKEVNFFAYDDFVAGRWAADQDPPKSSRFRTRTLKEYEALFTDVGDEVAIGEASPVYLRALTAPEQIRQHIPDMKLVVSLRNPADRAYSGFLMRVRKGDARLHADEMLTAESHHVVQGFYYEPLKRYFDTFPSNQIKVMIFEEFAADPTAALADLYDFLGVDTDFLPDTSQRHNVGGIPKNAVLSRFLHNSSWIRQVRSVMPGWVQKLAKRISQRNLKPSPPISPDLRAELLDLYRDDIHSLETLLGRDLNVWLES